jgi:proline iminopeptidase
MGAQSFYDYAYDAAYTWNDVYTNMPIIDYLWGEAFGNMNLIQSLADIHKPVFIGLGRYDYLVAPVSLWDRVDDTYENVKKMIFEHSGHNPMFEEPHYFDQTLAKWINEDH